MGLQEQVTLPMTAGQTVTIVVDGWGSHAGSYTLHIGPITRDFLKKTVSEFSQHFYVCGPEEFTNTVAEDLSALGASPDTIVFEK